MSSKIKGQTQFNAAFGSQIAASISPVATYATSNLEVRIMKSPVPPPPTD